MDQDRKKWLDEAMNEMTVNEADEMVKIVDQLDLIRQGASAEEDEIVALFENLQDMVEHIDQAFNLHKVERMVNVIDMLRDPNPLFRKQAAAIIATISQNNLKVQVEAIVHGALGHVTHMVVYDEDKDVRTKALWALSCLIRNFSGGEGKFVQADGIFVLCRGVRDVDVRVRMKSLHLLSYLLNRDGSLRTDDVVNVYGMKVGEFGLYQDLVDMIGSEDGVDVAEGVLEILMKLQILPNPRAGLLAAGLPEKLTAHQKALSTLEGEERDDKQGEIELLTTLQEALTKDVKVEYRRTAEAAAAAAAAAAPPPVKALEPKGDPLD